MYLAQEFSVPMSSELHVLFQSYLVPIIAAFRHGCIAIQRPFPVHPQGPYLSLNTLSHPLLNISAPVNVRLEARVTLLH